MKNLKLPVAVKPAFLLVGLLVILPASRVFGLQSPVQLPNPAPAEVNNLRGIIGLTNHGQPRKPDDWGALHAWAWGASRGLDYLETDPAVAANKVGIEGVSRYGKAALVTASCSMA